MKFINISPISVCNKKQVKKYLCMMASTGMLIGCGGSGQDAGISADISPQSFSGVAIDGHLARATVFIDSNNNGTRDAWESFAFTDNEGYYSYNPNTDTNYCASNATAEQQQYCLSSSTNMSTAVIRVDGGYDILTGEPFLGQISRRVTPSNTSETTNTVISPITTLMTNIEDTSEQTTLLTSLGLQASDLDVDYLNNGGQGVIDSHLLNTATKIHKTVAVLSDRLVDTYDLIGEESGTPNNASAMVYRNLASEMISSGSSNLDQALSNNSVIANVLDRSENEIRNVYTQRELVLPNDMGSDASSSAFSRVINITSNIPTVVDRLIDPLNTNLTTEEAIGGSRALESIVIKAVNETNTNDSTLDNAVNFFTNNNNDELVSALTTSLSRDTADVASLANNDFSGDDFDSADEIDAASQLPDDAVAFSEIAGKQLRVSDLDLGFGPNRLKDTEVEVYFIGEQGSISGSLIACAKFIEDAHEDGTLGEANTRGELVTGFWSLLGSTSSTTSSYSILLTFEFLGANYQAIMKNAGPTTIHDVEYQQIRFDNDGDFKIWHSIDGIVDSEALPTSNTDCESRLPSRIGI